MARGCFYDLFSHIEDNSNLANLFNKVLHELETVRIMSAPSTFEIEKKGENCAYLFYESCLWEMYMHGVIDKLNRWKDILNEYESEFGSSWQYYASAKRLESIKEYGGKGEDYDSEGNIRTVNLSDEDLKYYTVIRDLVQDDWRDIVQETKPEHLDGLCSALQTNARISVTDIFKQAFGTEIPTYKEDESGNMIPMTFSDKTLSKAADEVQAENLSTMMLYVCHCLQFIIGKIRALDRYKNNKDELLSIHKDVECLLNTDFIGMDIFNEILK
jgi:hypothetical protein|nr:MAG TPA: hypothetical protein [Caudoviricetes sp.]